MSYDNYKLQTPDSMNDESVSLSELENERFEMQKKQNAIFERETRIQKRIEKNESRIEKIRGLFFTVDPESDSDLLKKSKVIEHTNNILRAQIEKSNLRWIELENKIDELTYQIKKL